MIKILKFIFLGFIQGITEPIPVSSSGHLLIVEHIVDLGLNAKQLEMLATITNFGSLIAVIILFRKKIFELIKHFFRYFKTGEKQYFNDAKYCIYLVIATIPAGIMGIIVVKLKLFNFLEQNIKFIGLMLLVTGLFLYLIKDFKYKKDSDKMNIKDAIIIGLYQVIALIPGISRSGATIVGGSYRKLTRETAFDFSFMLYIPISVATTLLGIKDILAFNESIITYTGLGIAMIISAIFTYISLRWFKKLVVNGKLIYFVIYCLILGLSVILFLK